MRKTLVASSIVLGSLFALGAAQAATPALQAPAAASPTDSAPVKVHKKTKKHVLKVAKHHDAKAKDKAVIKKETPKA